MNREKKTRTDGQLPDGTLTNGIDRVTLVRPDDQTKPNIIKRIGLVIVLVFVIAMLSNQFHVNACIPIDIFY